MSATLPVTGGPVAVPARARLAPGERRRLARRYRWRRYLVALGFLAPSLVFFSVFLLWPTLQVAYQTLYTGGILGDLRYVGLDNWTKLPGNAIAIRSLTNSVTFSLLVVPAMMHHRPGPGDAPRRDQAGRRVVPCPPLLPDARARRGRQPHLAVHRPS